MKGAAPQEDVFNKEKIRHLNVARLKKGGEIFEVDIDVDKALHYLEGESIKMHEILNAENIYTDTKKGMLASEHHLKSVFGTTDVFEIAKDILSEGEIQLDQEHRQKIRQRKKKRVMAILQRNAVDPRTHLPIPLKRIENAFEEAKIKIEPQKKPEAQLNRILDDLRPVLPIKFEIKEIDILIPSKYAGKASNALRTMGKVIKEEWKNDGSLRLVVNIPGGLEEEFYEKLNHLTHGDNVVKTKSKD